MLAKPKLLLDTTFILPLFGFDVGLADFEEFFLAALERYAILVNSLSFLEAKWKALREARRNPEVLEAYSDGLRSIVFSEDVTVVPFHDPVVDDLATALIRYHGDYFDCSIAASALVDANVLLTEDEKIADLVDVGRELAQQHRRAHGELEVLSYGELRAKLLGR